MRTFTRNKKIKKNTGAFLRATAVPAGTAESAY